MLHTSALQGLYLTPTFGMDSGGVCCEAMRKKGGRVMEGTF